MYFDCVELVLCLFFFFFKQKTAYEMRISDWSSDVCSSDLNLWRFSEVGPKPTVVPPFSGERRLSGRTDEALFLERYSDRQFYLVRHAPHPLASAHLPPLPPRPAPHAPLPPLLHPPPPPPPPPPLPPPPPPPPLPPPPPPPPPP